MKPIEIFKSGTHTSNKGETLSFTDDDLANIAASYDASLHHAPIVVGHPKQDGPAYGWIDKLSVAKGRLVAAVADVDTAFSDLVKEGKFRKVSAAFYRPDDKNNPSPGKWYLRHVGFLGAAAPAVKGLKAIEFADADEAEFVEVEFSDGLASSMMENIARLFRGLRDMMIERDGVEATNKTLPDWDVLYLEKQAAELRARERPHSPNFSETDEEGSMTDEEKAALDRREAEVKAREDEIAAREAEHSSKETAFSERTRAARAAADSSFVEMLVSDGKLPVGFKGHLEAVFADLSDEEVSFSEGAEEIKASPRTALRDLFTKMPKLVSDGEIMGGEGAVDFSDTAAVSVAIKSEIKKAADAGENISPSEASRRLRNNRS